MALGNAQSMWTLREYIEKYDKLQDENKRLREELEKHRWISERLPKNLKRVVVAYKNSLGKLRITIAEYIQPRSILAEEYLSEDCPIQFAESDYDKSKDCYWTPSGWYESTYHGEINLYIRETIICWMPIPIIPSKP